MNKTFLDYLLSEMDDPANDPAGSDQSSLPKNVTNMRTRAARMNAKAQEKVAREKGDKFGVQIARKDNQRAILAQKRDNAIRRDEKRQQTQVNL